MRATPRWSARWVNCPRAAVHLIETVDDARQFTPRDADRLAVLTQTTLSVDDTREIVARAEGALPLMAHHAAQGRHLLRHDQPPGRGEAHRAVLRPHDRGGLAQQLEFAPSRRGRRARRLPSCRADRARGRDRMGRFQRHRAARRDGRRLGARKFWSTRSSTPSRRASRRGSRPSPRRDEDIAFKLPRELREVPAL